MSFWNFGRHTAQSTAKARIARAHEAQDRHALLSIHYSALAEDCSLSAKQHLESAAHFRAVADRLSKSTNEGFSK